jgi:oligoribonuclease NrnB/cAMP/cGMP phosphodiesterase (DHH superfamily)
MHNYDLRLQNIIFTNYIYLKELLLHLRKIRIKNAAIVFTDIGMSLGDLKNYNAIIKLLKSDGNTIIWVDDHPWDKKVVEAVNKNLDFAAFGESGKYCATELVYILLCNRDRVSKKIATLAHYSDFAIKSRYDHLIEKLSYSIVYLGYDERKKVAMLSKVIKSISTLDFNNPLINNSYKLYMKDEAKAKKILLENSLAIKAGSYKIGIGFGNRLQTNSACALLAKNFKSDINIYINIKTGKGGIRSKDYVDCSPIAKILGGGGHPQACGFQFNPSKFQNHNKIATKNFVNKLQKISKKLYK